MVWLWDWYGWELIVCCYVCCSVLICFEDLILVFYFCWYVFYNCKFDLCEESVDYDCIGNVVVWCNLWVEVFVVK